MAVQADQQVTQQFDVLTKELRVLADLTNVPTGYSAALVHLRTVLHTAAVIILTNRSRQHPAQRIGYGLDHTLDHFSQRRRDAVALGDPEDQDTFDEVIADVRAYAGALGLTFIQGRIGGLASTDSARVEAAWSALGAHADLSSAVHGRRRGQLARIDQVDDTGDSDADLMAVALLWAMRSLYFASRSITALASTPARMTSAPPPLIGSVRRCTCSLTSAARSRRLGRGLGGRSRGGRGEGQPQLVSEGRSGDCPANCASTVRTHVSVLLRRP